MSSQLPFGLTLLLLLAGAAQAEVQVWVEPRLADELDPITLTLRATDADIGDEPDLSVSSGMDPKSLPTPRGTVRSW